MKHDPSPLLLDPVEHPNICSDISEVYILGEYLEEAGYCVNAWWIGYISGYRKRYSCYNFNGVASLDVTPIRKKVCLESTHQNQGQFWLDSQEDYIKIMVFHDYCILSSGAGPGQPDVDVIFTTSTTMHAIVTSTYNANKHQHEPQQ